MQTVGNNRWFTAGDNRFNPENLVIDSREGNFIAIIEKSTYNIVWRLGLRSEKAVTEPDLSNFRVPTT